MNQVSKKHLMKKSVLFLIIIIVAGYNLKAQNTYDDIRVITTAVPFMMIAPDARSGAMGEAGVATEPDANSMHWNPAKYAFIDKDFGFGIGYSPWLRRLVNDINIAYVSGFGRIDDKSTVAATLRYFSLGDITFTDEFGNDLGTYRPNEFALDATYARKFSETISGAVAARFIYSNLTQGQYVQGAETRPGTSIAADVAVYYEKPVSMGSTDGEVRWGINISNIGTKMSYSSSTIKRDFIPTNFRVGAGFTVDLDDYNSLAATLDVNKLLVPTPPVYLKDSSGMPVYDQEGNLVVDKGMNPDVSTVQGIIQSWYDAPYGFSEEMREFSFAFGLEYWYAKQFSVRGGFFYEDATKGNRRFFTVGAGLRYNVFGLDLSYLIPVQQQNPLENTLRFTLLFNFDKSKKESAPTQQ
jgi:hypothetical protein